MTEWHSNEYHGVTTVITAVMERKLKSGNGWLAGRNTVAAMVMGCEWLVLEWG